jgi:hypothetical protein
MDVDSPIVDSERDKDSFVIVSNPTSPTPPAEASSSKSQETSKPEEIVDVEMQDASGSVNQVIPKATPSFSPRKTAATSDSSMMFGRHIPVATMVSTNRTL